MRAGRARRGERRPQVAGDRDQPTAGPDILHAIARPALNGYLDWRERCAHWRMSSSALKRYYYFAGYSFYRKAMAKCRTQQGMSRRADPFRLLTAILERGDAGRSQHCPQSKRGTSYREADHTSKHGLADRRPGRAVKSRRADTCRGGHRQSLPLSRPMLSGCAPQSSFNRRASLAHGA